MSEDIIWPSLANLRPAGRFTLPAGASTTTVTCAACKSPSSIILTQMESNDVTATFTRSVVPGFGSFVVTTNAAATAAVTFSYVVVNIAGVPAT